MLLTNPALVHERRKVQTHCFTIAKLKVLVPSLISLSSSPRCPCYVVWNFSFLHPQAPWRQRSSRHQQQQQLALEMLWRIFCVSPISLQGFIQALALQERWQLQNWILPPLPVLSSLRQMTCVHKEWIDCVRPCASMTGTGFLEKSPFISS